MLFFLLLLAPALWAQEPFQLSHAVLAMEQTSTGTQVSYRLYLANHSAHSFHDVRLSLYDVSLSLTDLGGSLEFHTLSASQGKQRLLSLNSALEQTQLTPSDSLMFHLQAIDEQGQLYSILLRSQGVSP